MTTNSLEISVSEANNCDNTLLLDVRKPSELEICKIEGALHIPMNEILNQLDKLPSDKRIAIFCHHGGRSLSITQTLRNAGHSNVFSMSGGIHSWATEIDTNLSTY